MHGREQWRINMALMPKLKNKSLRAKRKNLRSNNNKPKWLNPKLSILFADWREKLWMPLRGKYQLPSSCPLVERKLGGIANTFISHRTKCLTTESRVFVVTEGKWIHNLYYPERKRIHWCWGALNPLLTQTTHWITGVEAKRMIVTSLW